MEDLLLSVYRYEDVGNTQNCSCISVALSWISHVHVGLQQACKANFHWLNPFFMHSREPYKYRTLHNKRLMLWERRLAA